MAKNLLINGVTYNAVDSLSVPISGGGTAAFPDTSDATADAADIANGKTAYVNAVKVTGTSTGGGGGTPTPVSLKDINFYDYDGVLLYSWTLAELASASALPANPTHTGLTAQGWNWSLADLKTENAKMNVGQMYITDDGKTRLYITITTEGRMDVRLMWIQSASYGVTIDWGDGSATYSVTITGNKNTTHNYAAIGNYIITLNVTSGTLSLGNGSSTDSVMGAVTTGAGNIAYCNMLKKVEIGSNVTSIGDYAFKSCYSLASITIPSSVTSIGSYTFQNCYSLVLATIPSNVTSIDTYAFQACYSLASITIPSSVTSIDTYVFNNCYALASITIPSAVESIGASMVQVCYSLASITIPNSVTSIGDAAFRYCYGIAHYYVYPTTPPTLGGTSCFDSIASDAIIHVPTASEAAYKAATNWAEYAAIIVGDL